MIVWGCFAASGPGPINDTTMNSALYQNILEENVRLSVLVLKLNRKLIMQQDNVPILTRRSTKEWLQKKKFRILEWPRQSPYRNPMGMLWQHLTPAVHTRKPEHDILTSHDYSSQPCHTPEHDMLTSSHDESTPEHDILTSYH